jgi:hypothetical protein
MLKLDCNKEYDHRKIEISLREDKNLHKTENIINEYFKAYRYLEPLYFVLKKFLYNTNLCKISEPSNRNEYPVKEGLGSYTLILMIVALFQSMRYQLKIADADINQRFDNMGALLMSFFNIYGNQIDIDRCDISPSMPNAEMANPFNERIPDMHYAPALGLRVFDPETKQCVQMYMMSSKLKRILSFAYLYPMGCCDCLDWSSGCYLAPKDQIKKLLDEEKRDTGYIRYILPKLLSIQEEFFFISMP